MVFGKKQNKESKDLVYLVQMAQRLAETLDCSLLGVLIESDARIVEAHIVELLKVKAGSQDKVIDGGVL